MLEVIYPTSDKCIICKNPIENQDKLICLHCNEKIKRCKSPMNLESKYESYRFICYSASYYSNLVREMIVRLKYKSDFICGEVLADYMYDVIKENNIKYDIITFVPTSKKRKKVRGYNQSEYIAKCIAKKNDIEVVNCLYKSKDTKDQIGLNGEERWKNIEGSFKILKKIDIKNKIILLVDDVVTTGATAYMCALELKKNGAKDIKVLTAAKSRI